MKNGSRLCGTGAARSSTPILQNKAYWEFKLQQAGVWSCGLANPGCDLNKDLGNDLNSWALTHENVIMVNGNVEQKLSQKISEGDIIVSDYFQVYKRNSPFIIINQSSLARFFLDFFLQYFSIDILANYQVKK